MTKNMKKVVNRIKAGIECNDETHPVNFPKAMNYLQRKTNENTSNIVDSVIDSNSVLLNRLQDEDGSGE